MPEIKIVKVGAVEGGLLEYLTLTLPGTFDARCRILGASVDPRPAYSALRRQYNSSSLLDSLRELDAGDGKILGVTDVDLFIPVLTFVFGEAQLGGPAAVFSSRRLSQRFYGLPEDRALFLTRCEKEAAHELGHAYGLVHCRGHECLMHFSNSVEQVDLKQSALCPSCSATLKAGAVAQSEAPAAGV